MGCSCFEENDNVFSLCLPGTVQNQYKEHSTVSGKNHALEHYPHSKDRILNLLEAVLRPNPKLKFSVLILR